MSREARRRPGSAGESAKDRRQRLESALEGVLAGDARQAGLEPFFRREIANADLLDLLRFERRQLFYAGQCYDTNFTFRERIAFGVLHSRTPMQQPATDTYVRELVAYFVEANSHLIPLGPSDGARKGLAARPSWLRLKLNRSEDRPLLDGNQARALLLKKFPRKKNRMASTKVNVFLDVLLDDAYDLGQAFYNYVVDYISRLLDGAYFEDQICAAIIYAWCTRVHMPVSLGLKFALISIIAADRAKSFSNVIKSMGMNRLALGAAVCESACLSGRGVGDLDLRADALPRTKPEGGPAVPVDYRALRHCVAQILGEELRDRRTVSLSADQFWYERFKWCVGGAHGKRTNDEAYWGNLGSLDELGHRMSRRVAVEHVDRNIMLEWDGTIKVSVLPKLECGKVRAIYSCNTMSYLWFSRLLRPIEEAWRGEKVILDPGQGGASGMCNRILGLATGGYNTFCMLDYADFNSQHTIESQKIVIEEALRYVEGWSEADKERLISSFDHMYLYLCGEPLGRVTGTLMSGHRATSFINSVLNAAYLRMSVGPKLCDQIRSLHVGDDVLILARNAGVGYEVYQKMEGDGFRLQPTKQSIGAECFEFLRVCGTRVGARGYLCRSVASLVGGNWTSDERLQPAECLSMLIQQSRSLINRSSNDDAWRLLVGTCSLKTGFDRPLCGNLLSGKVAVEPGPCYRRDGRYVSVKVSEVVDPSWKSPARPDYMKLPHHATSDYVRRGAASLEHLACLLCGFVPWIAAVRSSYGDLARGLSEGGASERYVLEASEPTIRWKRGAVSATTVWGQDKKHGLLVHYPLIALLQNALSYSSVERLLAQINHFAPAGQAVVHAFGGTQEGATVDGYLPYSDAAAVAQYELISSVKATYPVAV